MMIYKILTTEQWNDLNRDGITSGAPIDLADGYIHFSTATQAQETADKHFAGAEGLFVAAVDGAALGEDLKWEVSRGGAKFPHLYAQLSIDQIQWCEPLPLVDGTHKFPDKMV